MRDRFINPFGVFATIALLAIFGVANAHAEDPLPDVARLQSSPVLRHLKKNPISAPPKTPAEETVANMYVPEGFRVDLVLAEPDLQQPIAFTFDERGRLWVAEAYSYPTKRPPGQGEDKIVIFEDKDGDGKFETRKVFADGLNLVSGLEVGYGGVWVGAAPELLFIPDANHDDIPDGPPQVLLDGFGYQDTHETLNSFIWGPDGWLYGLQGVFNLAHIGKPGAPESERAELRAGVWRYHPTKHTFEIFARGGSNAWGLDYDEHGQFFMTHCRSYWGGGCVTHVIQGGEYWNQANANYSPWIINDPPAEYPDLRNFLLASAHHDHGAGGAGARGTDAIYGGHSHVGTMIYYGDNWPEEYRGQLFTHNLGGHQINREINKRSGSGFETVHAESDMLFCTDPTYVAVALKYGPDGAVYFIDWSDRQHCHNPNTERWDRTNGRMYRMEWEKTYKPVKVNLSTNTLEELTNFDSNPNAWFQRTARRLVEERWPAMPKTRLKTATPHFNETKAAGRLHELWAIHSISTQTDADSSIEYSRQLKDADEFVRAWAVQFSAESPQLDMMNLSEFERLSKDDSSPVVRRYLASALQRIPETNGWEIAQSLSQRAEDKDDRNIPKLLYQSIAQRMTNGANVARALAIAKETAIPQLRDWIYWYAVSGSARGPRAEAGIPPVSSSTTNSSMPLDIILTEASTSAPAAQRRLLAILAHALSTRANVDAPPTWTKLSATLYSNSDERVVQLAEKIGVAFGDRSRFPKLRADLADAVNKPATRKHAFEVLTRAQDAESLPTFITLLDDSAFTSAVIPQLARYDSPNIPKTLIDHFAKFSAEQRAAALNVLTARPASALALLDAVESKKIARDQLSAFHIRQLTQLNNAEVEKRATAVWGRFNKTSDEKKTQVDRLEKTFNEAPLWAYSANAGRDHFKKLCSQCHKLGDDGVLFGPNLTGSAQHGIRYFLENVIDPNAVVGADFQMTNVETKDGELVTGLLAGETDSAVTIRTQTDRVTIPKTKIARRELSDKSIMPEGLLDTLQPREQIELLKYLTAK